MPDFLALGYPLSNLRLLSEREYRTETQVLYENLSYRRFNFIHLSAVSAAALLFFASLTPPTPKKMGVFFVGVITAGLILYAATLPKKPPLDDEIQRIFQETADFVQSASTAEDDPSDSETQNMRENAARVTLYASKIHSRRIEDIPSELRDQWNRLLRPACEKMLPFPTSSV